MRLSPTLLAAALLTSGCAGSDTYNNILQQGNNVRIEPARNAGADFDVTIKNVWDIGYNPENKDERDKVALSMAKKNCSRGAEVVGENVITTGSYLTGKPARDYIVHVKCQTS